MKIITLIKLFEKGIVNYTKALNLIKDLPLTDAEKIYYLVSLNMHLGLCFYFKSTYNKNIYKLFESKGYYNTLVTRGDQYLFERLPHIKSMPKRIKFMQDEIKSLNKLLKRGYTHI